jgi:hypothetical protein
LDGDPMRLLAAVYAVVLCLCCVGAGSAYERAAEMERPVWAKSSRTWVRNVTEGRWARGS